MIVVKILAVLSATMLVIAVAVATLGPQEMSLAEALTALDNMRYTAVEAYFRLHISAWIWEHPVRALLVRPPWLVPAAAGVLLGGAAMTMASTQKAPNSRRRRS
ncbi:hypothetical protein [Acidisphaera sp. L21]|uniref:hypothetical protein n=1 Tax=Acidisphaera sp. L21 TaxID=1641851 RepID=UPI00131BD804|nr:hypothetical protein [Acidisphaera sp. L21]